MPALIIMFKNMKKEMMIAMSDMMRIMVRKKNYCLTLMINGYDHEYSEYDDEMQMQIKSL